jgi:hypothetical protein
MLEVTSIAKSPPNYAKLFSVCCIVNDIEEYNEMQQTFINKGFNDDCEYLIANNTKENRFDAYQAIRVFLEKANARYIIITHQDVRAMDTKDHLLSCLHELDEKDPGWAICGNAGGIHYHEIILYLKNGQRDKISTNKLPQKVKTLDENFLVIKKEAHLSVSADLSGFHLYGTDICLLAKIRGYTCYVIPFLVNHLSEGNLKDLESFEKDFLLSYGEKLNMGFVQTTCTRFYISNSELKNRILNYPFVFRFIKIFFAIRRGLFKVLKKEL